jgi:membrane-bound inhibitor of C-type lysozyme
VIRYAAPAIAVLAATPAASDVLTATYHCERGVEVPATYVNADEPVAVITVEGSQITLILERSASGARYGWPSGGSNYVWWIKGNAATLYWRDSASGTETILLSDCVARE